MGIFIMSNLNNIDKIPNVKLNKNIKVELRKKELFRHLNSNKLIYKNSICDSYILYGTPSVYDVVDKLINKRENEENRRDKLINILDKYGIKYDKRILIFQKYIQYGGKIDDIIKAGCLELWYWNKTDYLNLLKSHDDEVARNIAVNKYIKKNGHDEYTN